MVHFLNSIEKMFEGFSAGTPLGKFLIGCGSLATAFFSPIAALLVACFGFTIVDLVYGLKVAKKQKQKITSDKTWKGTLSKLIDEFTIISLARLLEFAVLGNSTDVFVLTGGATVVIGLTELWSILENLNTLKPNGPWKALGRFLKKKGEDYTGINIIEENEYSDNSKMDCSESK